MDNWPLNDQDFLLFPCSVSGSLLSPELFILLMVQNWQSLKMSFRRPWSLLTEKSLASYETLYSKLNV